MQRILHAPAATGITKSQQPRPRACEACREAKTKCVVLAGQSQCDYCCKHERLCIVPQARKARIKTAEKFAALEKQIQALGTALETQNSVTTFRPSSQEHESSPTGQALIQRDDKNAVNLDLRTKQVLITHWNMCMQPYFPAIGMVNIETLSNASQTSVLELMILCIASLAVLPTVSTCLIKLANEELLRRVYISEEQSTELALTLLLHSQFFGHDEKPTKFRFSPHTYTASAMAVDLGLDRLASTLHLHDDHNAAESIRVWLARYCVVTVSAALLNRQRLADEVSDLDSVMHSLLKHRHTIVTDSRLCSLVRLNQIVSESSRITLNQEKTAFIHHATNAQSVQLSQRLESWVYATSQESDSPDGTAAKLLLYNAVRLYVNRVAILDFRLKFVQLLAGQPQKTQSGKDQQIFNSDHISLMQHLRSSLSTSHWSALNVCLISCEEALRHFDFLSISIARDLPVFYYQWMLFTIVCLLKLAPLAEDLRSAASQSDSMSSPERSTQNEPDKALEIYTNKLQAICRDGHVPQVKIFLDISRRLKVYYAQRKEICMNAQVEGCTHAPGTNDRRALNLLRDDFHQVEIEARSIEDGAENPEPSRKAQQSQFDVVATAAQAETSLIPAGTDDFTAQIDEFFMNEDDSQWLEFLDWDWT